MRPTLGRALRRRRRLRTGIVQLAYVVAAFGLGLAVPQIPVGFTVPSGRTIESLLAVGAAIVTFIGVVYSLLFLVVQFGSTMFTPRLNLFRDAPIVWNAFGFFTSILVFSFTAAFSIGGNERTSGLVPITLVLALLAAVALFRALQTGAFRSIQLAHTLVQLTEHGRDVIEGVYPAMLERSSRADTVVATGPARPPEIVWSQRSAVLQTINVPRLVESAERADAVIELTVSPGETLHEGAVVARIRGPQDRGLAGEVVAALEAGPERTFEQDPGLALRVLVDIALRALSPAVNDPTTAVQALDAIDSILRSLASRDLDVGHVTDAADQVRVVLNLPSWEEYVSLALDELIDAGSASLQVRARLDRLLNDLVSLVPRERRPPLEGRLDELRRNRTDTVRQP
jgi:uncharacterized membrane protein